MPQVARRISAANDSLIIRCVANFVVDQFVRLAAVHDGDIVTATVFLAIKQASAAWNQDAARPIGIRTTAQSLNLAYETTRRRVADLEAAGFVRRLGRAGVAVIPEALCSPARRALAAETRQELLRLFGILAEMGVTFIHGYAINAAPPDSQTLDLLVTDLCEGFLLRVLEVGDGQDDFMDRLVFNGLITANAAPFTYQPAVAMRYRTSDNPPPESLRRAATIAEVSQRIKTPHEVVRRRVQRMIQQGRVRRVHAGYMADRQYLQTPAMKEGTAAVNRRVVQLAESLAALGLKLPAHPDLVAISPLRRYP